MVRKSQRRCFRVKISFFCGRYGQYFVPTNRANLELFADFGVSFSAGSQKKELARVPFLFATLDENRDRRKKRGCFLAASYRFRGSSNPTGGAKLNLAQKRILVSETEQLMTKSVVLFCCF